MALEIRLHKDQYIDLITASGKIYRGLPLFRDRYNLTEACLFMATIQQYGGACLAWTRDLARNSSCNCSNYFR